MSECRECGGVAVKESNITLCSGCFKAFCHQIKLELKEEEGYENESYVM
tara:strand:- start:155 stop:301 length:147 start_codon:yes stop_codon:yes gene_type:complete